MIPLHYAYAMIYEIFYKRTYIHLTLYTVIYFYTFLPKSHKVIHTCNIQLRTYQSKYKYYIISKHNINANY